MALSWRFGSGGSGCDFIAVVDHRLIPARVRCEWARLRAEGLASERAPASQESSHVGHAGDGVISMKGAPLSLPTFATAQFKRFFDCGRAVRCMLPVASGRFLHLVVLYGYQGADTDAEQLTLTEQLFDAALGELAVVARPRLGSGLTWTLLGLLPEVSCWWQSEGLLGWLPAGCCCRTLVLYALAGGYNLTLLLAPLSTVAGGCVESLSLFGVRPSGLLLCCLLFIRAGTPSLLRSRGSGGFMMTSCVSWHRPST